MRDYFSNLTSNILANISIIDVIDILVVAFIVYKILGFIKDTRAQQLVKGILAIVVVFFISDFLQLNTLNWMLRTIMTMGVIALIILFQPELRRGLEYVGRAGFLSGRFSGDKNKAKQVVDAVVEATEHLSNSRTGALIVIERDVTLGDIAETGTLLSADITSPLLENIFYKGSPLHDGAVILRGDKVLAAGCVLPLSTSRDLEIDMGTRHRAALGITESSDAVTIVVSEENGIISCAKDNKLTRYLDGKSLEKLLLNLYLTEEEEGKSALDRLKKWMGGSQDAEE